MSRLLPPCFQVADGGRDSAAAHALSHGQSGHQQRHHPPAPDSLFTSLLPGRQAAGGYSIMPSSDAHDPDIHSIGNTSQRTLPVSTHPSPSSSDAHAAHPAAPLAAPLAGPLPPLRLHSQLSTPHQDAYHGLPSCPQSVGHDASGAHRGHSRESRSEHSLEEEAGVGWGQGSTGRSLPTATVGPGPGYSKLESRGSLDEKGEASAGHAQNTGLRGAAGTGDAGGPQRLRLGSGGVGDGMGLPASGSLPVGGGQHSGRGGEFGLAVEEPSELTDEGHLV